MANKKTTKRALLFSVLSMVLCVSMLMGTTFAWFTDSVTSANNIIKSGNLDLEVEYTLDGENWKAALERHSAAVNKAWVRRQLDIYREKGYTYLRDGGDRWGVGAYARELAREYGITYKTPLAPLCKAGCYGSFIGVQ